MNLKCFSKTKYWIGVLAITLTFTFCSPTDKSTEPTDDPRPNIILLVADDLGYADLGCYGGDVHTPNIDRLANQGIIFSRFHTANMCAPTRAMLLSGNDNHIAGMGAQGLVSNRFGYEGHLTDRIIPMPLLLQTAGYHTYMAGKWHLGKKSEDDPREKGFERSFVNLRGAGNHFDDQGIFKENPISIYSEDGQPASWPKGAYSTDFFTDKLIEYIGGNAGDGKPFFAFGAYTSPHWPLQVEESYWKKYEGCYDKGYEVLRAERLESLKKAGLIPQDSELPPIHPRVIPWDSLSSDQQKWESRAMALYAGMVENLDYNVGRLLNHLEEIGELDNTLIVFMSDNGAAAEDFYNHENYGPFIREHFNIDYEDMGKANSFISYGPQWAEAGTSPFRYFKGYTTEGGQNTVMLMSGKGVTLKDSINHSFATVMDLAPTFYEVAGITYPSTFNDKPVYPLKGASLMNVASGRLDRTHGSDYVFAFEHYNMAVIRKGDWKIVNEVRPLNRENFKLYNLSKDLNETEDLRDLEPEKYQELLEEWDRFADEIQLNPGE